MALDKCQCSISIWAIKLYFNETPMFIIFRFFHVILIDFFFLCITAASVRYQKTFNVTFRQSKMCWFTSDRTMDAMRSVQWPRSCNELWKSTVVQRFWGMSEIWMLLLPFQWNLLMLIDDRHNEEKWGVHKQIIDTIFICHVFYLFRCVICQWDVRDL